MDLTKSSYQYEKEEVNVDVRYFEDLKDYFAETNQYGMLEENASIEAEVPYVFQTENLCLIAGFTVGTKGQLLNIVQQFEKDEYEGKDMDIWNVYILHIYLLILLQELCKWIPTMLYECWSPFCHHFGLNTLHINAYFVAFWRLLYHAAHHSSLMYE